MDINLSAKICEKINELSKLTGISEIEITEKALIEYLERNSTTKDYKDNNLLSVNNVKAPSPFLLNNEFKDDSEYVYRKLLETLPEIILRTDISGKIIYINDDVPPSWGDFKKEEVLGKNMMEFIDEIDKEKAIENTKKMFLTPLGLQEYSLNLGTGTKFKCEINGDILRDNDGNPLGMVYVLRNITERIRMEEALRQSENRFKALAKASFEGIVFTENDIIFDANEQYANMFGYEVNELIGRKVIDLLAPESKEPVMDAIHSENEIHYEHLALRKDGSIFPVEAHGRIINIENNKIHVTTVLDISERIQAQELVAKSEDRFRSMIQNLSDTIHILDINGVIFYESPSSQKVLGYETGFLIGKKPFDFIHPEDREKAIKAFQNIIISNTSGKPTEYRFRHSDGRYIFLETIGLNLIINPDINGILLTSRDVTERKISEESLRESERQFRAFLNSTEDLAFLKDASGKYLYVNYAMSEVLEHNEDEIIGKTDYDLLPKPLADNNTKMDEEALNSDEVIIHENKFENTTTETRIFKIQLKNDQYGVGGIIRDITKKKKLERQVIQSEKMSVVGELAGGIAHDLNNILTVLIGNTELLERRIDFQCKKKVNKYLEAISKANLRAKDIVLQILAFSKRQEINRTNIDLNDIVIDMSKMLARLIPENIKVINDLAPERLIINADISQIEQIIMNVVINARDAIIENGLIHLTTKKEEINFDIITRNGIMKPGTYALLLIKDNGSGIPANIIDKIFDPFFTTKEIGKGTGLGLSIVINNISKNDAFLNLYSEINNGTEFKIYFPLSPDIELYYEETSLEDTYLGNGETILIVEDDESIRFLLVEYLRDLNYNIISANNGIEAIELLDNENVNAILTDITMPEMGGKELFNNIRNKNINVPIVAMSGYYQHSEVKNLGFYEILDKPLDMTKVSELFFKIFHGTA
jgi:two-component system, cell cycle sensor histidine kinase and response regulator CckA